MSITMPTRFKKQIPIENGRQIADDIFEIFSFNENCCILIQISLRYVSKSPTDNKTVLVQIMALYRTGNKPLSEPVVA